MRLRQLVLACGLTSFVLSPYASALGLGEVKLKSSLNQPLEAEVKLLDTRDLTAEQILVSLASPADFERNGVERLYFYTELQFQVILNAPDGPKVIIRSRNPVREPYLNFLIEARWTAGRLLREYTLLMDLPTFDEDAPRASVSAPAQAPSPRYQTTAPTSSAVSAPRSAPAQAASAAKPSLSGDQYEVRANDTLWEIALRAKSNSSISVHQSMMALYRANPDAFINGNINKLRRGQVLRIPDAAEMTSVARSDAVAQFAQATNDAGYGAQLNASRRSAPAAAESAEVSGRVKLAAPAAASKPGQGSGANDGTGKALTTELTATLEELDKTKSENAELSSRVKDLEAQIETMERLVSVSNEKLRALQVAAEQTAQGAAAIEAAKDSEAQVAVSSESPAQMAVTSKAASSAAAVAAPPLPAAPKPQKPAPKPVAEPSVFDSFKDNPMWLALALLGIFGAGAAAFAYRRRQQAQEAELAEDESFTFEETPDTQEELTSLDEPEPTDESDKPLFEDDQELTAVAETGDVVGEADIYIAYGKLDQAEEMLVNALEKDPESADIRMKLLEVYAQQENVPAFDKQYAALLPLAGATLIARASELRGGMAGAGEFNPDAGVSDTAFNEFSLDDFELDSSELQAIDSVSADSEMADLDVTDLAEPELQAAQPDAIASPEDEEFNFDFDLDLDDDASVLASLTPASDQQAPQASALDDEFEFDLGDLDLPDSEPKDATPDAALDNDELLAAPKVSSDLVGDSEISPASEQEFKGLGLVSSPLSSDNQSVESDSDSLEVVADDFNLDMDVEDVDLAALDHEMESLDVDFDDDLAADDEPAISEFAAAEIAKDENELGLDLDDDTLPLHREEGVDFLADDLGSSKLVLTDDLDKPADELELDFDSELLNLEGDQLAELDLTDTDDAADFDASGESDSELLGEVDFDGAGSLAAAESALSEANSASVESNQEVAEELDLSDEAFDFDSLSEEFNELDAEAMLQGISAETETDETPETLVDLELDDEIPSDLSDLDELQAYSKTIAEPAASGADEAVTLDELAEPAIEDKQDEDLFAQALSDFGSEDEELNLDDYASDESTLADLSDDEMDSELDFLADADEVATKLDLARAYIDMGDAEGAKDILSEVVAEGSEEQCKEANELLSRIV